MHYFNASLLSHMLRIISNKKIFLILFIFISFQKTHAWADDILVVQSAQLQVYNNALQGFETIVLRDISTRGLKTIQPHTVTTRILSAEKNLQHLKQEIARRHPDLLLVIGSSSLALVKGISDIPIIYLLAPNPGLVAGTQDNITGINMNVTAKQQLTSLIHLIPEIKRIGLLYNPDRTGTLVREAEEFAKRIGIHLVALPVKTSKEIPSRLARMKDKIDCYWMLPDQTVITPQTLDYIFLFSLENRIPVLTFAEKYLKLGATLSVSFDATDMGKQAGELALKILNGTKVSDFSPVQVRKVNVRVNHLAAKLLGIDIMALNSHE